KYVGKCIWFSVAILLLNDARPAQAIDIVARMIVLFILSPYAIIYSIDYIGVVDPQDIRFYCDSIVQSVTLMYYSFGDSTVVWR
ncbi:MAG: hypothetical protein CL789_03625, partial [Chloroflexi bacterium]|nr:hypothetical protein [Chloroflexota bacterium]